MRSRDRRSWGIPGACFLALLLAPAVFAQRTVVTGTVTDPQGIPYAGGTIQATLTLPLGAGGATLAGAQVQGTTGRVTLDSTGSFLMQLPDNAVVLPGGTQWRFDVTISPGIPPPAGTGPQSFSVTVTITGATQSISAQLQSAAPVLSNGPQTNAIYAANPVYGVKANTKFVRDATWTNGSGAITCPNNDCNFVSADTGKACYGINSSLGTNTLPFGSFTFTGPQSGTCSVAATGSVVAAGNFVWGTDDTAAWQAALAAALASQAPATIVGPNGQTIVTKAPLVDTRTGTPPWQISFSSAGFTQFFPAPNFDFTTCGTGCIFSGSLVPQDNLPQYSKVSNLGVQGMQFNACPAAAQNKNIVRLNRAEGQNIWVWDWCLNVTGMNGVFLASPNSISNLNVNNAGIVGVTVGPGANTMTWLTTSYMGQGMNTCLEVQANAVLVSTGNFYLGAAGQCVIVDAGGLMSMTGDNLNGVSGNQFVDVFGTLLISGNTQLTASNNNGHALLTRATGKIFVRDSTIKETGTSGIAFNVNLVPGGSIVNQGGNTLVGTDQTLLAASNIALGVGWGTTATVTNLTGTPDSNPVRFTFQVNSLGTGQAANPTLTLTYPAPLPSAPLLTCKQVGGTGAVNPITGESAASTTAVSLTWNGTPVAALTYLLTCTGAL